MKIICLRAYAAGYTGFLEEPDQYVFFSFSKQGLCRRIKAYEKSDYRHYAHFVAHLRRFAPSHHFMKSPISIATLNREALDRVHRRSLALKDRSGASMLGAG